MSKRTQGEEASEQEKNKRTRFNFTEMGIPIGAKLVSNKEGISAEVFVSSDRKVKIADSNDEISLCKATREILKINNNMHPCRHWKYEGKVLSDYYSKTYTLR